MPQSTQGRLQSLAIILSLVFLFTCAHGFFPTPWREKTFGNSGVSHIEQTEQAFQTLAARYFPTTEMLTKSMLRARDVIAAANADVDKDQENDFKHCDGETFDAAQARLLDLQGQVIEFLVQNKPDDARKALGSALHTVQDFYSHSNWVEMGSETISDILGRAGNFSFAGPFDRTCVDCNPANPIGTSDAYCFDCRNNEYGMTSMLTSGYYFDKRESNPDIPEFKCHHGGYTGNVHGDVVDLMSPKLVTDRLGGINKDSLHCEWSPHAYAHRDAVSFAVNATIQYIDDIQQKITTSQLRLLFGVGQTLAFVIDTTSSMGDILGSLRTSIIGLVSNRLGTPDEPSSYFVSLFNDSHNGTLTITTDFNVFKDIMQSVTTSGGGDCPEISMVGLLDAVTILEEGSTIFMFTDAALKDSDIAVDVTTMAIAKNILIEMFKFDSDCDDSLIAKGSNSLCDNIYSAVAIGTGGGYHSIPCSKVASVGGIIDSLTRMDNNFILRVAGNEVASSNSYTVPVDSSMTQVTFSLRGMEASMSLIQPNGGPLDLASKNVRSVVLLDGTFVTVVNPAAGYWEVRMSAMGSFSLNAYGVSSLQLISFKFAALAGRPDHTGYFSLEGSPPYTADIAAIGSMSGSFQTAAFEFRNSADLVVQTFSMEAGSGAFGDPSTNSFFTLLRLSAGERYLYVIGLDIVGQPYQRVLPSMIMPICPNSTYSFDNSTLLNSSFTGPMISSSSISSTNLTSHTSTTSNGKFSTYYANTSTCLTVFPHSINSLKPTGSAYYAKSSKYSGFSTSANSSTGITSSPYFTPSKYVSSANTLSSTYYSNGSTYSSVFSAKNFSSCSTFPIYKNGSEHSTATYSLSSTYLTTSANLGIVSSIFTRSPSFMTSISSPSIKTFPYRNNTTTTHSAISTTASKVSRYFANSTTVALGPYPTYSTPAISENISVPHVSASDSYTTSSNCLTRPHSLRGYTVTEILYTTTSLCPTTVSTSISGMPTKIVNNVVSTIILTSTILIPCHKCSKPSEIVTLPAYAETITPYENSGLVSTTPMTITEIVYTTTLLCPVTLSASIVSGSTLYSITTSVSTLTLTMTSSVICRKCRPPYDTVTLSLVEISASRQNTYGSVSISVSPYLVASSPSPRTYGAISLTVSELGYSSNEGSRIAAISADTVTISLAHVSPSYGSARAGAHETASALNSNAGAIETAPANVIIVSLLRPPQPYATTLIGTYEISAVTGTGNGVTQTSSDNLSSVSLCQPSGTCGIAPASVFKSVSNQNTKIMISSPVTGATISLDLLPDEYKGTIGETPKSSALSVPASYRSEESSMMSSGRVNTIPIASLSLPTPATTLSYGPEEVVVPNLVPSNTSLPTNPHYTYHGSLYTGSADRVLKIFGGSGVVRLLVAVFGGIIVVRTI